MTDDIRKADLTPVRDSIDRIMARVEAQRKFLEDFRCPDPTGQTAPCHPVGDLQEPAIVGPGGGAPCPAAKGENCPPYRRHQELVEWVAQDAWEREAQKIGIKRDHWAASFRSTRRTEPLEATQRWFNATRGRGLMLLGPNGVGKSYAACAAIRDWKGSRWFVYAADLSSILMTPRGEEAMERAVRSDLLVIDNLGAEYLKPDGMWLSRLDSIIYHREADRRPLIITSRMAWTAPRGDTLRARMTADMVDRVESWMVCEQFTGESLRPRDA